MSVEQTQSKGRIPSVGSGELVRPFVAGEHVDYLNHVAEYEIGTLEIQSVDSGLVRASKVGDKLAAFVFYSDGQATWSSNLSIRHKPNVTAQPCRSGGPGKTEKSRS